MLLGLAAIIAATGPSVAAVLVAVRQNRTTRREVAQHHAETQAEVAAQTDRLDRKVDEKAAEHAAATSALHDVFTGYMNGVNATLAAMADLSQLAVPFMEDYRKRNPEVYGK